MVKQEGQLSIESLIKSAGLGEDKSVSVETKSSENIDITQNANWYDANGIVNAVKNMTAERGQLLSRLGEGFEGSNLPVNYPIPYDVTNYFMKGKTAWVDSARPTLANKQVSDAKSTLSQVDFILQMGITDKMIKHSTDKQLYDYVVKMLSKAAISTMEGCIINGDNETAGTGNINTDDQAAATTFAADGGAQYHSLKIDHGIRELAINGTGLKVDVGAFDSDDVKSVQACLAERHQVMESDLLAIWNPSTYLTACTDDAFKLAYATQSPTVNGKPLDAWGMESIKHDLMPKTEADGKLSATAANNVKGSFAIVRKSAIRWGFGQDVMIEVERIQGYGYELTATMEFGFVILDPTGSVALGYDVTL